MQTNESMRQSSVPPRDEKFPANMMHLKRLSESLRNTALMLNQSREIASDYYGLPKEKAKADILEEDVYKSSGSILTAIKSAELLLADNCTDENIVPFLRSIVNNTMTSTQRMQVALISHAGYEAAIPFRGDVGMAKWSNSGIFPLSGIKEQMAFSSAQIGAYHVLRMLGTDVADLPTPIPVSETLGDRAPLSPLTTRLYDILNSISYTQELHKLFANYSDFARHKAQGKLDVSFNPTVDTVMKAAPKMAALRGVLLASALLASEAGEPNDDNRLLSVLESILSPNADAHVRWVSNNSAHFTWQSTQGGQKDSLARFGRDVMGTFIGLTAEEQAKDTAHIIEYGKLLAWYLSRENVSLDKFPHLASAANEVAPTMNALYIRLQELRDGQN